MDRAASIFVHEDLSKPENRINVALFGLMIDPAFRAWFQARLCLPSNSVIYPPKNAVSDEGSGRPDFAVTQDGRIVAWIEVECDKNEEQLLRYQRMYSQQRVISVWGRASYKSDLSLEEISGFLDHALPTWSPQASFNGEYLKSMIDDVLASGFRSRSKTPVSASMRSSRLLRDLSALLGEVFSFEIAGRMWPGQIRADAQGPNGYSIRVYSKKARVASRSVSVLFRSSGQAQIGFQSKRKLNDYLPGRTGQIDQLAAFVCVLGGDMDQDRSYVPLVRIEEKVEQLANNLRSLMG